MNKKKIKLFVICFIIVSFILFSFLRAKFKPETGEIVKEFSPILGSIETVISTTGTVLPKNRLEITPPVAGRIDNIIVKEGDYVKAGDTLAWMSSTERAALLDAARGQGEAKLKYWEDVYKPIALLAPIDGQVIVATTQPGQTVTTSDAVIVLSDQLIVRAQVDETDIGKIEVNQRAAIILDAYPDAAVDAKVEHIYYESETSNNVTIYKVDLIPDEVPVFFRSGMNATVDFKVETKENILLLPVNAVRKENGESYVLLKQQDGQGIAKRAIKVGITDDKNYEVISGLSSSDVVIIASKKYILPNNNIGSNPFMPNMKKEKASTEKK